MPYTTIKPNAVDTSIYQPNATIYGGAASINAALSDSSDVTYVRKAATDSVPPYVACVALEDPTIPASNDIAAVVPRLRWERFVSTTAVLATLASKSGSAWVLGAAFAADLVVGSPRSGGSNPSTVGHLTPAGGAWTQAAVNALFVLLSDNAGLVGQATKLYETFAYVYYCARPTSTAAVTSPVTDTSTPAIALTFSGIVEQYVGTNLWAGGAFEVKVFDAATYGAGGFDPTTSTPVWASSGTFTLPYGNGTDATTANASVTAGTALANGDYRAYVRAKRDFDSAAWGSWAYGAFTVAVEPADPPTLTAYVDQTLDRIVAWVTPIAKTGHTDPIIDVERSDDEGVTYVPVRGATGIAGAFGVESTFYDYEAPRGVSVRYRAHVTTTYAGATPTSNWAVDVAGIITADGWNLKVPSTPALNIIGARVLQDPAYQQDEDLGIFRPKGRRSAVVVSTGLGGADGAYEIWASTAAEWNALEALREHRGAILVESPYGWQRWHRWTSRRWVERGPAAGARRKLEVSFLEVGAD